MLAIPLLRPFLANWPGLAALIGLFLLFRILASPAFHHWLGESLVVRLCIRRLDSSIYQSYHDLHLPHSDCRDHSRIDHIIVSPFGIFVIATLKLRGSIFGSAKHCLWTQRVRHHDRRFDNPLHQNHRQVRDLACYLGLPEDLFRPVILFVGKPEFIACMPRNVLNRGLVAWIRNHRTPLLDSRDLHRATSRLETLTHFSHRRPVVHRQTGSLPIRSTG